MQCANTGKQTAETAGNQIIAEPIEFPSSDGTSIIKGFLWKPAGFDNPRGVVQLVHGMAEHIGRYDDFACFLATEGFLVCGHSHIGHGESVASPEDFGHMPVEDGEDVLINDVDTLRRAVEAGLPESVPYYLFGHSMGSLVVRVYVSRYGDGLAGAVVCGTAHEPVALSMAGNMLAKRVAHSKGDRMRSELIHSLADGAFSKAIDDPRTAMDWVSLNEENVDAYLADDMTGFMFTAGGYATLTQLARDAVSESIARGIPRDLPMLFISGWEDPVGDFGSGVFKAAHAARDAGVRRVQLMLYPEMRHEILNEKGNAQVYADVLAWLSLNGASGCVCS